MLRYWMEEELGAREDGLGMRVGKYNIQLFLMVASIEFNCASAYSSLGKVKTKQLENS